MDGAAATAGAAAFLLDAGFGDVAVQEQIPIGAQVVGAVIQVAARAALGALGIHAGAHDEDGDSADDRADHNGNPNAYVLGLLIIDDIFLVAVVIVARGIRITVNGRAVTVGGKIGGQSVQECVKGAIIIAVFQRYGRALSPTCWMP